MLLCCGKAGVAPSGACPSSPLRAWTVRDIGGKEVVLRNGFFFCLWVGHLMALFHGSLFPRQGPESRPSRQYRPRFVNPKIVNWGCVHYLKSGHAAQPGQRRGHPASNRPWVPQLTNPLVNVPKSPPNATKPLLFCCVQWRQIKNRGLSPLNRCGGHCAPAASPLVLRDRPRSQQNNGFVSLGCRVPPL